MTEALKVLGFFALLWISAPVLIGAGTMLFILGVEAFSMLGWVWSILLIIAVLAAINARA